MIARPPPLPQWASRPPGDIYLDQSKAAHPCPVSREDRTMPGHLGINVPDLRAYKCRMHAPITSLIAGAIAAAVVGSMPPAIRGRRTSSGARSDRRNHLFPLAGPLPLLGQVMPDIVRVEDPRHIGDPGAEQVRTGHREFSTCPPPQSWPDQIDRMPDTFELPHQPRPAPVTVGVLRGSH
jgi:hypothetical protein